MRQLLYYNLHKPAVSELIGSFGSMVSILNDLNLFKQDQLGLKAGSLFRSSSHMHEQHMGDDSSPMHSVTGNSAHFKLGIVLSQVALRFADG